MFLQPSIRKLRTFSLLVFKVQKFPSSCKLNLIVYIYDSELYLVRVFFVAYWIYFVKIYILDDSLLIHLLVYMAFDAGQIEKLPKLVEDIVQTSINTGPRGVTRLVQGVQAFVGVGGEWLNDLSKVAEIIFLLMMSNYL